MSYDIMKDEEADYKTAKAFGEFKKYLSGIDSKSLHETIPGFHNTPFEAFEIAIKNDSAGRVGGA